MEIESLNLVNDSLISSKKELQSTLNKFVARCESLEHELFAITEVNREMEIVKREELNGINQEVARLMHEEEQLQMLVEDVSSRCADYKDQLREARKAIFRLGLSCTFLRPAVAYLRDRILEHVQDIDDMKS